MTNYNKGDVVLVRFPNADFKSYKKRPALIVQSEKIKTGLPQRIVVSITSNLKRKGNTRIKVYSNSPEGQMMGIVMDSVIVVDNLITVLDKEIDKKIGICPLMVEVNQALKLIFDL